MSKLQSHKVYCFGNACTNMCTSVHTDKESNIPKCLCVQHTERERIFNDIDSFESTQASNVFNNPCPGEIEGMVTKQVENKESANTEMTGVEFSTIKEDPWCKDGLDCKRNIIASTVNDPHCFSTPEKKVVRPNHTNLVEKESSNEPDLYDLYFKEAQDMLSELQYGEPTVEEPDDERRGLATADSQPNLKDLTQENNGNILANVEHYNDCEEKVCEQTNTDGVNTAMKSAKQRITDRINMLRPKKSTQHFQHRKTSDKVEVLNKKKDLCEGPSEREIGDVAEQPTSDNGERLKCFYCEKEFKQKCNLTHHLRTHTSGKPYGCFYCDKAFTLKGNLKRHLAAHTGAKPYECSYCSKAFAQKGNLKLHLRTHTGEKPYECSCCDKTFAQKVLLIHHLRKHTGETPYECSCCDKAFAQKGTLKLHLRTHTGEKPYECSCCDKTFAQKVRLIHHLRTHNGEKPYECSFCGKAFAGENSFNRHLRTHTIGKPYECSYCDKAFTYKCNLNQHLRTHTGEKPYECLYCNKAFAQVNNLKVHLRTHTGEKPYECLYCNKAFAQVNNLKVHLRTHTGEKSHGCLYCDKAFTRKVNLNRHLRTHTGEKL